MTWRRFIDGPVLRSFGLVIAAIVLFAYGHTVGSRATPEDPSPEFDLRFRSAEQVFYELTWSDGFLWMIDGNRDGILDEWIFWKKTGNGEYLIDFEVRDTNSDQRLDEWYRRTGRDKGVLAKDTDFDGIADEVTPITIVRKYQPPSGE